MNLTICRLPSDPPGPLSSSMFHTLLMTFSKTDRRTLGKRAGSDGKVVTISSANVAQVKGGSNVALRQMREKKKAARQ